MSGPKTKSRVGPRRRELAPDLPPGALRQRQARLRLHLTQADVAQYLGVSVQAVRLWEAGSTLYGKNLDALAAYLGRTPAELAEGRDKNRHGNKEARDILWGLVAELEELRGRLIEAIAKL